MAKLTSRSLGFTIFAIILGGILGSVLSRFLGGIFPSGPVRDFFFKGIEIGIPTVTTKIGFITLTFGLSLFITTFTVLLIILLIYILYKF